VLRRHGLNVTRLRLALLRALHQKGGVSTASELLERVQREQSIHKTTVYRNLQALEEAGLVRKLPSGRRSYAYELTCDHSPPVHPHFTCSRCETVVCLEPVDLSSIWGLLTQESGLRPERAEITLVGICSDCAREE
jgi:Fur family ferric uptake transcriptional regulator